AFGNDLAGLKRHQTSKILFGLAQSIAELADNFAAFWSGDGLPFLEGLVSAFDGLVVLVGCGGSDSGEKLSINRRNAFQGFSRAEPFTGEGSGICFFYAEALQNRFDR